MARGISSSRVKIESFGSTKAAAQPGDYEGYALDRYVNIEVVSKEHVAEQQEATEPELALAQ